jgi:hypothetical protein
MCQSFIFFFSPKYMAKSIITKLNLIKTMNFTRAKLMGNSFCNVVNKSLYLHNFFTYSVNTYFNLQV